MHGEIVKEHHIARLHFYRCGFFDRVIGQHERFDAAMAAFHAAQLVRARVDAQATHLIRRIRDKDHPCNHAVFV